MIDARGLFFKLQLPLFSAISNYAVEFRLSPGCKGSAVTASSQNHEKQVIVLPDSTPIREMGA